MKTATIGILLSPLLVMAQQNGGAWTNIGPGPAAVEAIAVDPQGTGTIFIGTIAGGVRKSLDHGTTWSAINSGLTNLAVLTLTMDASGPQTVYAGTSGNGLFKTGDGGASWKNLTAITGAVISVAADPKRPGVVYAAAFNNLASGSISKSIDGGVTWATIFPSTAAIYNITIDPGNSDVLYAPTVGHGAFKSTDGGQHWSSMLALTPAAIWTLALDPANIQVLYAGTNEDGIWKSTDAGNTWQHVGSPGPFPVYSVTVDASTHMVYAGTNGGGFWTSSDGGVTWQSTQQSTGLSNSMVLSLAMDPAGMLYAGTNSVGAKVSRDHGATWTTLNAGLDSVDKFAYGLWIDPSNGKKILVGNEAMYGLIGSQDGGATWSVAGQGFTGRGSRGVAFDPSDSQRIYAGAMIGNGFFKSTDGGLTWSLRKLGSPAVYVIAVAVDPSSPNAVYVGTQNEGFFRSENYGETLESIGRGLSGAITYLTVDPTDRGRLFACTATAFYLSEDGGNSWTNVLNFPAWTLTIDPGDPSTVYATARTQGVFRSSDGGYTWQSVNSGLTNLTMGRSAPVIVDPKNRQTLYVGGEGGVFKSLDAGGHWFAVNSGLSDLSVLGLAMDPSNSSLLYACGPNGIYKTLTGAEVQSASILITGFGNAASYAGGPVSPGEIVVITGYGLGPAELIPGTLGANGLYSTQLSGTTVRFNAIPAPLIYTSATQVAALVPDMVSLFSGGVQVTVTYEGRTSVSISSNVVSYYPGVFTLNATGTGQAVAQNEDGSINTASNPAKVGDVISLYVTGLRQADSPTSPVFVIIGMGGQAISSSTKDLMPGVLQVDARIPGGVQTGSAVPVLVVVGDPSLDSDSSTQLGVTIAVQPDPSVTATITSIGWATAVTTDPAGNVYFVSSNSVFKVDSRGVLTRIAGNLKPGYSGDGGPAMDAELYTDDLVSEEPAFGIPSGLATDLKGNLYISDGGNGRVRKISSDGITTTVAGNGSHGYSGDGGPATAAQISNPRGLAVDSAGNLYIADSAAVRMVSTAGIISTVAPFGGLGVAVDSGGNIFVVDYSRVRRVSPNGTVTTVAGGTGIVGVTGDGGPATSAGFIGPTAVASDRAGNLYIGDVSRVRKVSPDGIINTVAGGGKINLGDGEQAIDAQIAVESITIDAAGNLYIAGYRRVRKVLPDGTITTVAGNGN